MITTPQFTSAPWHDDASSALMQGTTVWNYAELCARTRERADRLTMLGVSAAHVVLAPDSPALDLTVMQHALAQLGAALLPYRTGLACAVVQALAAQTGAEWRWCPELNQITATGCGAASPYRASAPNAALALLITTSGSSGAPKVAMLTTGNLLASARAVNARLDLQAGDIWLACLRLSHIGGIAIGYRTALAGATLLLHDGFAAAAVVADLHRQPVTHLSLVPPMLARLLDLDPTPPPALRVLLVGGQATSPALVQRTLDAGWPLVLTYGMTETATQIATTNLSNLALLNPPHSPLLKGGFDSLPLAKRRVEGISSVGQLLPGVELIAPACTAPAQRLRVRGALVMAGYATPERQPGLGLVHGWFETADLGCLSAAGQLHIHGRADDVRVIGGNNVSLARVEAVVNAAEGVAEAVIVVLDDRVWGHRLIAVYRGDADAHHVHCWCQAQLAGAEQPRHLLRWCRLPLLASGKYDRQRLIAIVRRLVRHADLQR